MKHLSVLFSLIVSLLLVGCTSSSESTTQRITFSAYQLDIPLSYYRTEVADWVDPRIAPKIHSLYTTVLHDGFQDNLIISQDTLHPSASLEDYVQASIGGMSYTWSKYQSLDFQTNSLTCTALTIPMISVSFRIERLAPGSTSPHTLYFTQLYLHKVSEIITVSASTASESSLSDLESMMQTIACALPSTP